MRSNLFFADNYQSWNYETEQHPSDTIVGGGNRFDMTGSDFQGHTMLNVSTFRWGLRTRNTHNDNYDPDTTRTHCENSTTSNSTSWENPAQLERTLRNIAKRNVKKDFLCPQCPRAYSYVRSLKRHLKYECGKSCKFACPYCKKKSKLLEDCHRHIRNRHIGQPIYADQLY